MSQEQPDTHAKALQVNLEQSHYGTFAEIGAGQEVAPWFFRVGGAAGTIAKAMSACDMVFSDAIYGQSRWGRDDAAGGRRTHQAAKVARVPRQGQRDTSRLTQLS